MEHAAVIQALAEGRNPLTGASLPASSPYHEPLIIRALFSAAKALEYKNSPEKSNKSALANAGTPWSEALDLELIAAYEADNTIDALAEKYQRTAGAIRSKLIKLGQLPFAYS